MKKPLNTNERVKKFPFLTMAELMTKGTTAHIEDMEFHGQTKFTESDVLPIAFIEYPGAIHCQRPCKSSKILESMGVEFLGPVEDDDQFQYVRLPRGWKKVPLEHTSLWSELRNESDEVVAQIFYKAAFYDRHAHISITERWFK